MCQRVFIQWFLAKKRMVMPKCETEKVSLLWNWATKKPFVAIIFHHFNGRMRPNRFIIIVLKASACEQTYWNYYGKSIINSHLSGSILFSNGSRNESHCFFSVLFLLPIKSGAELVDAPCAMLAIRVFNWCSFIFNDQSLCPPFLCLCTQRKPWQR